MKRRNIILTVFFLIFISIIYVAININDFHKLKRFLVRNLPPNVSTFIRIVANTDGHLFEHYNNDYMVKFLPRTQFDTLSYKKIKLDFIKKDKIRNSYPYSFDLINDKLVIFTKVDGHLYFENTSNIIENKNLKFKKINSNLGFFKGKGKFLNFPDIYINDNKIYVLVSMEENDCKAAYLLKGTFNLKKINFEEIFSTKNIINCISKGVAMGGGRIQAVNNLEKHKLLVSFTHETFGKNVHKNIDQLENEKKENFGNIILIDEKNKEFFEIAKGFRNVMGLYADKEVILATDHGPKGGDEINKIKVNRHYGWPYVSYGEMYDQNDKNTEYPVFKKNHKKYNFEEPIYSFVYALGIAEIIKLPNDFSNFWEDNFLVSTLNSKHLLRIKFDDDFNKLIYTEKIYIGERVRDIKYYKNNKKIILALTSSGSLGILSNDN